MLMQLVITGLLVALLPLSVVWVSKDHNKYRKLIAITVFLTFDLIVFGAFTRLTDSGLGCPDWPGCYGQANPFQAHADIKLAEALLPTGPVTVVKAWIEMIHRYLAMSVGILIVAQMVIAWWHREKLQRSPLLPSFLFFFVCLQGAFGAWTVTLKLQPIIVTTHLLLGLGLLALLAWSLERERGMTFDHNRGLPYLIRVLAPLALVLLFSQIALGGWVSTNYAALACNGYPSCNGELVPNLDWEHGFTLWRQLGKTASGDYLPYSALVAIQWVHRSFAWIAFTAIASLIWTLRHDQRFAKLCWMIMSILLFQIVSGIATVYFNWPLALAVLHNAGAASLVLSLTMLNYRVRSCA